MYIGSPMQEEDAQCSDDDDKKNAHISNTQNNDGVGADDEDNSDDSMASDASSGPSHREQIRKKGEFNQNITHSKHEKGAKVKYSLQKKATKQEQKRGEISSRKEKNEKVQGK